MKFKSFVSALTAAALCFGLSHVIPEQSAAADEPIRILAVGDSITDGYINTDNGYRKYLCYYLQQNGIAYDMVGPKNSWTETATYDWNGTTISYDPAHAGNSGYAIMNYNGRSGTYEDMFSNTYTVDGVSGNMVQAYDPDVILLQIGTNDLLDARLEAGCVTGDICETTSALDRLETLVDEILANMDSTDVLFVSTIPDIDAANRVDWLNYYEWIYGIDVYNDTEALVAKVNQCVDTYNAGVAALVAEKQAEGKNVQFGDINSCIVISEGDLEDGVHPSEQGYAKMGAHWAEKITAYYGGEIVPPTTEATTESTTEESTEPTTEEITESTTEEPTEPTTEESTTEEPTEPTTEETTESTTEESTESTTEETTESTTEEPTESTTAETTESTTEEPTEETTETTTEELELFMLGDVYKDDQVTVLDIIALTKYMLGVETLDERGAACADMNEDGRVNAYDLALLKRYVLSITPMPL